MKCNIYEREIAKVGAVIRSTKFARFYKIAAQEFKHTFLICVTNQKSN